MAGSIETLVNSVIMNQPETDAEYAACFLLTYRNFLKPHELLVRVIEIYKRISQVKNSTYELEQAKVA